ncbi:MAG: cytidylate kinase-like family protein [Eubacteriales bacterium]|nr:cytidylate kinase-like family protein [Eubacteriales bacterium]
MEKKYPVITISRAYAAYGRTIAAALSKELGLPYYDKDFVHETAARSGYSEEDIEREGEDMSRSSQLMNSFLNNAVRYASSYDGIFKAQREVVLQLAKEPCIIVGRCADHILREEGVDSFNIYLYADLEHRIARAAEIEQDPNADIKKIAVKKDTQRRIYYKQYTGKEMGDTENYDVSLNVGKIGVENCVKILCELIRAQQ